MLLVQDVLNLLRSIVGDENLLLTIILIESALSIGLFVTIYRVVKRMRALVEQINDTAESLKNDMYLISGEISKMHNVLIIIDGKNNEMRRMLQLLKESNILEQLTYADYIRYAILTAGLQKQIAKDIEKLMQLVQQQQLKNDNSNGSTDRSRERNT